MKKQNTEQIFKELSVFIKDLYLDYSTLKENEDLKPSEWTFLKQLTILITFFRQWESTSADFKKWLEEEKIKLN